MNWLRRALWLWLAALLLSWGWQAVAPTPPLPAPAGAAVPLRPWMSGHRVAEEAGRVAYRVFGDARRPAVVLLHGNPGRGKHMQRLAESLAARWFVVVPDLPGFGESLPAPPELSFGATADAVFQVLDGLGVQRAHWLGFSMGGGTVLHAWEQQPARVASVTLLSSIGVQELELLGEHDLNHAVHELQRGLVVALRWLVPHFGHDGALARAQAYARWFSESDQRPLRGLLQRIDVPLLVIHGEDDGLVPVAAAREHHRLAPHSELWVGPHSHFMVFGDPPVFTPALDGFLTRAEAGDAATRSQAEPARVAAAARPFDDSSVPPATGIALVLLLVVIAAASLVSEDLACVGAGLLAARGQISFVAASGGAFLGIFVGDVLLFLAGRVLGRPALRRAPLRWVVSESDLDRASAWFAAKGPAAIFISRFTPGLRLPTYVAAGVAGTSLVFFTLWFALAGLLWTPVLVGLSMVLGEQMLEALTWVGEHTALGVAVVVLTLMLVLKLLVPSLTHRGRRQLRGRWLRLVRWEFWPTWVFYPPVVLYVLWLSLRHRGFGTVTAVNPAIPAGGFIGESKAAILSGLSGAGEAVPAWTLLPGGEPAARRAERVTAFVAEHGLGWPLVLKPDVGQRGSGVHVLHDEATLARCLAEADEDLILQEHVPGEEFGVFWVRHPDEPTGRVLSLTEKRLPTVTGDGQRTLDQLIHDDARACALAGVYVRGLGERAAEVPAAGEVVPITELGTHCLGAQFLDGQRLITPELTAAMASLAECYEGFAFGRFDLRAPSAEQLSAGQGLRIIELNGLTSEAAHIYDPRHGVLYAWRVLCEQWRLAFEIGAAQRARGAPVTSVWALLREALAYRRRATRRRD